MVHLARICGILDLDGFELRKVFYTREAGFASMSQDLYMSKRFRVPKNLSITPTEMKTVWYLTRFVHGLSLRSESGERNSPQDELDNFVLDCYEASKTGYRDVVGYKGGHYEKDLLSRLGVPCLNIESFGCPKYNVLTEEERIPLRCPLHEGKDPAFHCPLDEVFVFRDWVKRQIY